jgi:hypothetical protein
MNPAVTAFLADPELAKFDPKSDLAHAFVVLDRDAVRNRHARSFASALAWIVAQPKSMPEKLGRICRLIEFSKSREGTEVLIPSIKKFCGW